MANYDARYSDTGYNNNHGTSSKPYVITKNTPNSQRNITLRYNTGSSKPGNQYINERGETVTRVTLNAEGQSALKSSIGGNSTVVAGYPELSGESARQIANTVKTQGTPVTKITSQSMTTSNGVVTNYNIEYSQKMQSREINTPVTLYQDTSKFVPAESVFKKQELPNPYNIQGGSRSSPDVKKSDVFSEKLGKGFIFAEQVGMDLIQAKIPRPSRTRGEILKGVNTGFVPVVNDVFFETPKGSAEVVFKGEINKPVPSLIYDFGIARTRLNNIPFLNSLTKLKKESASDTFSRSEVKTTAFMAVTLPLSEVYVGRAFLGAYGVYSGLKTAVKDPTIPGIVEGGVYSGLGLSIFPTTKNIGSGNPNNFLVRETMKIKGRIKGDYVPIESRDVTFVEGVTIPRSKEYLLNLAKKTKEDVFVNIEYANGVSDTESVNVVRQKIVSNVHVTDKVLPKEFITESKPEFTAGFRKSNELYNFYTSAPESSGKSTAYLGYSGIGEGESSASRVVYGKPKPQILMFNDAVSEPPLLRGSVKDINKAQLFRSGETFVGAENIKGASNEGQLITPSKYVQETDLGSFLSKFGLKNMKKSFIPGYEGTPGTKINVDKSSKTFSIYKQVTPNKFYKLFPSLKEKLDFKFMGKDFNVLPSKKEYYKFEFYSAIKSKVNNNIVIPKSVNKLDIVEYNKERSVSKIYKSVSPSSRVRSSLVFSFSSSSKSSPISSGIFSSGVSSGYSSSLSSSSSISSLSSSIFSSKSSLSSSGVSSGYSSSLSSSSSISSLSSSIFSSKSSLSSSSSSSKISSSSSITNKSRPGDLTKYSKDIYYIKKKNKKYSSGRRVRGSLGLFVLPDLMSVNITEQRNYSRFGGGEAVAPRLKGRIKGQAFRAFNGIGTGRIESEQMRVNKYNLKQKVKI